jgi:hypothetical protein
VVRYPSRTGELVYFTGTFLGHRLVCTEADFWIFELTGGRYVEVFGYAYPGMEHLTTGDLPRRSSPRHYWI